MNPQTDRVIINSGDGDDLISAAPDMAELIVQVEGGGSGDDVLRVDGNLTINFTPLDMATGPNFTVNTSV